MPLVPLFMGIEVNWLLLVQAAFLVLFTTATETWLIAADFICSRGSRALFSQSLRCLPGQFLERRQGVGVKHFPTGAQAAFWYLQRQRVANPVLLAVSGTKRQELTSTALFMVFVFIQAKLRVLPALQQFLPTVLGNISEFQVLFNVKVTGKYIAIMFYNEIMPAVIAERAHGCGVTQQRRND